MAADFRHPQAPTWRPADFACWTLPVRLPEPHWTLLEGRGVPVDLAAGEALITQGDRTDDAVFVLLSGYVIIERGDGRHPTGLRLSGPGDLLGELAAWTAQERSATVRACGPVTALRVPAPTWRDFFGEPVRGSGPDPARPRLTALVDVLTHKLANREKWLVDARTQPTSVTAARLLLELARRWPDHHAKRAGRTRCVIPLSGRDLASLAAVPPKTMQAALKELRDAGLIALLAPTTILDEAGLHAHARRPPSRRSIRYPA
jgi:CRP-like cAMP-binding protein